MESKVELYKHTSSVSVLLYLFYMYMYSTVDQEILPVKYMSV